METPERWEADKDEYEAFCEMCDDMSFEYPDCTGIMEAELMYSMAYDGYNLRGLLFL